MERKLTQLHADIDQKDILLESSYLAAKILRMICEGTDRAIDENGRKRTFYQIVPVHTATRTDEAFNELEAFLTFFYRNFGTGKNLGWFSSEYEAFYNIVKAWEIWEKALSDKEKQPFFGQS